MEQSKIVDFSKHCSNILQYITNEETCKNSLIIPFLQLIGFNTFDPRFFQPEYSADMKKSGKCEKVDYAILFDGIPRIFIECKGVKDNLNTHDEQLRRYFNATTSVSLAVITNGIVYKFFTDMDNKNIMDTNPFFEFNFLDFSHNELSDLISFFSVNYSEEALYSFAEEKMYTSKISDIIKNILIAPNDEFVRFVLSQSNVVDGRITSRIIDKFGGIVKSSIKSTIVDILSKSLENEAENNSVHKILEKNEERNVVTTQDELKLFQKILDMCPGISWKDGLCYFSIMAETSPRTWFCRAYMENNYILLRIPINKVENCDLKYDKGPIEEATRFFFSNIDDLIKIEHLIKQAYVIGKNRGAI